ncbi:MAG: TonB-dependent siderophore receptor [Leptolyngbyaceae cyanobacterium bins.302]|nr:TonB-dependent siderophore receptor [Leptolyngbyaceae cyanobacterium bins.302]
MSRLICSLFLINAVVYFGTQLVSAQTVIPSNQEAPRIRAMNRPAKTMKEWMAQTESTPTPALVQVTNVKVDRSDDGLDITLETDGKPLAIDASKFRADGNVLIADIPNTVLALPEGKPFEATNPTTDITTIRVTQQDASTIRVSVVGTQALPTTEITLKANGLAYSLTPEADDPEEEVIVTGAGQTGYRVPNATTGTRLDIPLLDTPASIGVITNELIEDRAVRRAEDLAPYISGVTAGDVAQGGNTTDFTIRGFSTSSQTYLNGLRDGTPRLVLRDFANIDRIEVLKGFSSLLYGTGTPGGVVNYVTKKPQADPAYRISFDAGSFNFYRGEADLTGPLTEDKNLLYRLVLAFQGAESFVPNVEDNRILVAPSLVIKTGGGGTLTLEGEYYRLDKDFNSGAKFFNNQFYFDRSYTDPRNSNVNDFYRVSTYFDQPLGNQWSLHLSGQYINIQRTLNPLFTAITFRGNTLERFYRTIFEEFYQVNLRGEVRGNFNIGASEHKLLAGIEYNKFDVDLKGLAGTFFGSIDVANPTFDVAIPSGIRPAPFTFIEDDWGVYIQDFVKLGRFRLLAGLRYGEFGREFNSVDDRGGDFISPSVGLVYSITDSASVYASFSQSTQPQGGLLSGGGFADPRTATQYEIGAKVNLLRDRLSITAALYNLTQTNIAESDPSNPGFNILVGDIRSRGFELDIAGKITDNFSLITAYTLQDAEITKSILGIEGNTPINTPRHSLGIYGKYEFKAGAFSGFSLGAGVVYVSERKGDNSNTFDLPSYIKVDLGAAYKINRLTFRLAVENLFNERYALSSQNRANITQGSPLALTGSVSVEF